MADEERIEATMDAELSELMAAVAFERQMREPIQTDKDIESQADKIALNKDETLVDFLLRGEVAIDEELWGEAKEFWDVAENLVPDEVSENSTPDESLTNQLVAKEESRSEVMELAQQRLPELGTVGEILRDTFEIDPDWSIERAREEARETRSNFSDARERVPDEDTVEAPEERVREDLEGISEDLEDGDIFDAMERANRMHENIARMAIGGEDERLADVRSELLMNASHAWRMAAAAGVDHVDYETPGEEVSPAVPLPEDPPTVAEVFADLLGGPAMTLQAGEEEAVGAGQEPTNDR